MVLLEVLATNFPSSSSQLGRAGVGYIRLIDFDQVTVSSLNRHACAVLADVGIPKVTCMKDFLEKVCPERVFPGERGEEIDRLRSECKG